MRELGSPAGLRMLESLVYIIDNKDNVKSIIKDITKIRDEANAKIAVVGKIGEIDKLRTKAATALKEAEAELADAKAKAKGILGKAGSNAAKEKRRQARADEILSASEAREKKLDSRETRVAARESELQSYMNQAETLQNEAMALKSKADELIAEADKRLEKFNRFASQMQ